MAKHNPNLFYNIWYKIPGKDEDWVSWIESASIKQTDQYSGPIELSKKDAESVLEYFNVNHKCYRDNRSYEVRRIDFKR